MKINWKRILMAGIWSELLLDAIGITARYYAGSVFIPILTLSTLILMFLGGFWAARKIESRLLLQGVLVGIIANFVYYVLIIALVQTSRTNESIGALSGHIITAVVKILCTAAGAYVGGRRRKKSTA